MSYFLDHEIPKKGVGEKVGIVSTTRKIGNFFEIFSTIYKEKDNGCKKSDW